MKFCRSNFKNVIFIQVTVEYKFDNGACVPLRVHTIVISTQHCPEITQEQLRDDLLNKVIKTVVPKHLLGKSIKYLDKINALILV